jgi:hypothetical protein
MELLSSPTIIQDEPEAKIASTFQIKQKYLTSYVHYTAMIHCDIFFPFRNRPYQA